VRYFGLGAAGHKQLKIGRLATLTQVTKAVGKTIRAMANGSIDTADGARICNGLGIMRMCFETQKLDAFGVRMDEISRRMNGRPAIPSPLSIDHDETYRQSH
jgi:hypothetical protein